MAQDALRNHRPTADFGTGPTRLRDRVVYSLPNGMSVVARQFDDGWLLYTLADWRARRRAAFEVEDDGRLLFLEQPTDWSVGDLKLGLPLWATGLRDWES